MIPMLLASLLALLGATPDAPPLDLGAVHDAVGAPAGPPLSGETLERRLTALASEIRCPVCQGQAIVDSPAESARHMKDQVRMMLAAGYSDQQVLTWLEGRYGEFIRLAPRAEGLNLIVWILPLALMLAGAIVVAVILAKNKRAAERDPGGSDE